MESNALDRVLRTWELSAALHDTEPGASPADIEAAEQELGRRLPGAAKELYGAVAGGELLTGNLSLYPLQPPRGHDEALALTTASSLLRSWDWPVPDEMVVFGDNGAGDSFGLWLPADGADARPLVVEVGEVFEDACLAVVGEDLPKFLLGWTAYYLLLADDEIDTTPAADALGLPSELRSVDDDGSDDELFAMLRWGSPGLPDPRPDPYERGLTRAQVDDIARTR